MGNSRKSEHKVPLEQTFLQGQQKYLKIQAKKILVEASMWSYKIAELNGGVQLNNFNFCFLISPTNVHRITEPQMVWVGKEP